MALQDPIEPQSNNEPLHKESAVDQSGSIRPWFRNWLERKRLQIGEIISGVNRNSANIAQLETDYQNGDNNLSAAVLMEAGVRAAADEAAASSVTALEASVRLEAPRNNLIPDQFQMPREQDWRDDSDIALLYNAVFSDTTNQSPYLSQDAFKIVTSDADGRIALTPDIGSTYFADIANRAARVFLDSSKTYAARLRLFLQGTTSATLFARDAGGSLTQIATTSSTGDVEFTDDWSPTTSGEYSFELQVSSASGGADCWIYRLQLVDMASGEAAADIPFVSQGVAAEKTLRSRVTTTSEAVADIEGNLSASYALTVDADGRIAQMRLLSDGTTSSVAFTADVFKIYDGSSDVAPFSVSGGVVTMQNVEINGSLMVNGSVNTTQLASGAVTNTETDQTAAALTPTNNVWTDVADFSFTSVGIGVQLRGSCEVDIFTDGTSPTAQVRILRGATVLKTSKVFAAVDAGSGFQKVEQSIALDYNDLPSSGTYTYKLQARLNEGTSAVVVSTFDVTNRFLSATELKR